MNFHKQLLIVILLALFSTSVVAERLVVIGTSLSAGAQSAEFHENTQQNAYPLLVAQQAGFEFEMPMLDVKKKKRKEPDAFVTNLAVPSHRLRDALYATPGDFIYKGDRSINFRTMYLTWQILKPQADGLKLSQVDWAEVLEPDVVIVELGVNDILLSAMKGNADTVTPIDVFSSDYHKMMDRLSQLTDKIVVMNVPDISRIPYFSRPEKVLSDEEKARISVFIAQYNAIIADQAERVGAVLVDANQLFSEIHDDEIHTDLFSEDLVHPSNKLHAIMADGMITAMNQGFGFNIPNLDLEALGE